MKMIDIISELANPDVDVHVVNKKAVYENLPRIVAMFNNQYIYDMTMKMVVGHLFNDYDVQIKFAYLNQQLVGVIMTSKSSVKNEVEIYSRITRTDIDLPQTDGVEEVRDIVLSVCVDQNERGKGIFTRLMEGVSKPYYVHLNSLFSPMNIWNKQGCKVILEFDQINSLGICA